MAETGPGLTAVSRAPRVPETPAVLVVHERYRQRGGEDAVVEAEVDLLRAHGHRVDRLILNNEQIPEHAGLASRARLAAGTVWSFAGAELIRRRTARDRPDVVHVHNFLPLLSPSIHGAARSNGAAVVQTLHNYRLVCPAGTLFRDGAPCEDCVGRRIASPAVVHACYRTSRLQSAVVATMLAAHAAIGTWTRDVDAFIAVSETVRDLVVAGGLPPERVVVKGNFVEDARRGPGIADAATPRDATGRREATSDDGGPSFLYVGRLTVEKGVDVLLAAWRGATDLPPLVIAGDGPLAADVAAAAAQDPRIRFAGRLDRAAVRDAMVAATALLFPSRWYEGQPVTILEAFAAGLPVLGSRIGSIPGLVTDGETGSLFAPNDAADLARAVRTAGARLEAMQAMGVAARTAYELRHTPDANYRRLADVYGHAMRHRLGDRVPSGAA